MRYPALFLIPLIFFVPAIAQDKQSRQLVKKIDQLVAESYSSIAPGCVVLVASKDELIYRKAFGMADLELNVAMQPGMNFRIGSTTKQFTAVAILQLMEQGKLSLQDSLQKFIRFPFKGHTITIENLLTHTSGITDYGVLDAHIPNTIRIDFLAQVFVDSLAALPLEFIPGSQYSYSNSNYYFLGLVIEQITGKKYKDYMAENIFKPIGLSNTYYDSPAEIIINRAKGYTKDSSNFKNAGYISMTQVFSAGALLSSVDDLYKWHKALLAHKLVKKETLDKAFSPFKLVNGQFSDYGYGWFLKDFYGEKTIAHGGAIDGFRSMAIYFPKTNIYMVILLNAGNDSFYELFEKISMLIAGKSLESSYKDIAIADSVLNKYVGRYVYVDDTTQFISIYKKDKRLYADLSNKTGIGMQLAAQSSTLFYLPAIKRMPTTIEFIIENGKVTSLYWIQEKKYKGIKQPADHLNPL